MSRCRMRYATPAFIWYGLLPSLSLAACSSGPDRIPVVQLAEHAATIVVGDTTRAWLLPVLLPGYVPEVEWSSSDAAIAKVEPTAARAARVTGLRVGEAVILVAGEGAEDSLAVTVITVGP